MGAGLDTAILCQILPQHTENNNSKTSVSSTQPLGSPVAHSSDFWLAEHPNLKALHASNQKEEFDALMEVAVNRVNLAMRAYD